MAEVYALPSQSVTGAATKTIVSILAGTTRRARILKVFIGFSGAPADNAAEFMLRRFTADGTGTAINGQPVDGLGPAAILTGKQNYTVEPTYASIAAPAGPLYDFVMNQRASLTWFATQETEKFTTNLTAGNGIGLQEQAGPAIATNATLTFEE